MSSYYGEINVLLVGTTMAHMTQNKGNMCTNITI